MRHPRNELQTGRQLKAARVLAGIDQVELARRANLHTNSIRYLERQSRIRTWHSRDRVLEALAGLGIECFASPAPGVRYSCDG